MTKDDKAELVGRIYAGILHTANLVLRNCSMFHITLLQKENPSYDEVAEHLEKLCGILEVLGHGDGDGEFTAQKAREYASHVRDIARAIVRGDEDELQQHVEHLNRRSFL